MKKILLCLILLFQLIQTKAQKFEVDTIYYSGRTENRINLVILGDGYQQHELAKFVVDARNFYNTFHLTNPFLQYHDFFNVFAVKVPSKESGASHPGTAMDESTNDSQPVISVDNYFGSTFDHNGLHRLIFPTKTTEIANVLAANTPYYDSVLLLVNSPYYAGSGWNDQFAAATLYDLTYNLAIHEIGHSFGNLADEYYAGDSYATETINMTQNNDPATIRWKNWYNTNDIGIYQHEVSGQLKSWYKPHLNCKMSIIRQAFCSVCTEGIVEEIHNLVSPIDAFTPSDTQNPGQTFPMKFQLELIESQPSYLNIEWILNGKTLDQHEKVLELNKSDLIPGENILRVQVYDDIFMVRVDNHENIHMAMVQWTINSSTLGIEDIAEQKLKIKLFPNPTEGLFKLNITAENVNTYSLKLYDVNGRVMLSKKNLRTAKEEALNLEKLTSGIYTLSVVLDNGVVFSKKIIKK